MSFVNYKSLYLQKSTFLNDSDVYFVSKVSCRTEIAGNLRQQRNPSGDKEFSNSLKAVMLCTRGGGLPYETDGDARRKF